MRRQFALRLAHDGNQLSASWNNQEAIIPSNSRSCQVSRLGSSARPSVHLSIRPSVRSSIRPSSSRETQCRQPCRLYNIPHQRIHYKRRIIIKIGERKDTSAEFVRVNSTMTRSWATTNGDIFHHVDRYLSVAGTRDDTGR